MNARPPAVAVLAVVVLGAPAGAQTSPAVAARALRSAAVTASPTSAPMSVQTLIENRARVLAGQTSPNGTRYWVATDRTLAEANTASLLDRLVPPSITSQDRVRTLDVLVDIRRRLILRPAPGQTVAIGTAVIAADVRNINVNAQISAQDITIFGR